MRNLTITRTKTFVGCAMSLKVYIEDPFGTDPTAATTTINGVMCRLLGKIKNGATETYEIGNEAGRVYVIADKLSKSYCNEFYPLPAGEEDISLSGRPRFNPATGNAFRFDGVVDPEVLANRKRGVGKGTLVLIIAMVVGFVGGFVLSNVLFSGLGDPKDFTCEELTITLTEKFERDAELEGQYLNYTAVYSTDEAIAFLIESPLTEYPGLAGKSAQAFAELCAASHGLKAEDVHTTDGLVYYEYPFTDDRLQQIAFFFKSDEAFWEVRFAVFAEDIDEMRPHVMEWAKSVTFAE